MTDEKLIEEMAKDINNAWAIKPNGDIFAINKKLNKNDIEMLAHQLVEQGYRKLPEDAVVLTKEEYDGKEIVVEMSGGHKLRLSVGKFGEMSQIHEKYIRKETARDILQFINDDRWGYWDSCDCGKDETYWRDGSLQGTLNELAKQYGVEVEE